MDWIEAAVKTTTEGIEPVSGILIMNGVSGYTVKDKNDFKEFLKEKKIYWDYIEDSLMSLLESDTVITFYIPNDNSGSEQLDSIKADLERLKKEAQRNEYGELSVVLKSIAEEDWANNWKKYFKPLTIGEKLVIQPTWEPENSYNEKIIVKIDPSSSFGTGSHATTKLCLEYIEKIDRIIGIGNYQMLDVGCGSGILGIAANKLSGAFITAIDIDENSIRVAAENFDINSIDKNKYTLYLGSITESEELFCEIAKKKYKLIAANIVADVLKEMAPCFKKLLDKDGYAVISGIISERADEVEDCYLKEGFSVVDKKNSDGWTAIVLSHADKKRPV